MEKSGKQKRSALFWALLMVLSFLVSACQTLPFQPPEKVLRKRVSAMMTAKINQEWGKVYNYLGPEYRNRVSKTQFEGFDRKRHFKRFNIEALEINPSGEKAVVKVRYDMTAWSFDFTNQLDTQNWIKKGGNWYLHIEDEDSNILSPKSNKT